jgi:hypothetical protein
MTLTNGDALASKKEQKVENYICNNCKKEYQSRNGLWKHKNKCIYIKTHIDETQCNEATDKGVENNEKLVEYLMKENKELKDLILEVVKNINTNTNINNTHSHNTTNSHNKAFNLNFFLNETCKNAMNITDFVDSIKLQLSDLMSVGEMGYIEGISKIIVKNLNNLDETERPVHCTDKKRETMYVKDDDKWEKEDDTKSRLRRAVNSIADKNIRLLPQFREKYPDYSNSSSTTSDIYDKMVIEVMQTDKDKMEKVIKNISKATIIKEH